MIAARAAAAIDQISRDNSCTENDEAKPVLGLAFFFNMSRNKPKFEKSLLDNGMVLVTECLPQFQSLSIGVWVNAGTRHEGKGEEGMSHFLEHMMFKGTQRRTALDIAREVDRVGGEFNAFTSREYTCFHLLLLARDIDLAADIMTDVLLSSELAADEIERERKVILQEISMVEDNPEELIHDLFFEHAFGGHPLGKPILGTRETISKFDRELVYSYFRRHYSPSQMVVSVAGDIEHAKVKKLFNKYLKKGLKTSSVSHRKTNMHRPTLNSGLQSVKRDLEQAHVVVGFPAVNNDSADRFAAFLLNTYLGGGMSSTLFQEIREKRGLAYTVYSALTPFSDSGLFTVYVATAPKEVKTCLEVMSQEMANLRDKKLEKKNVQILKDNLRGTILLNSDSVESRMSSIAKNEMFFGRYVSMDEVTRSIDKVSAEDIRRLARQLFKPQQTIVSVLGPKRYPTLAQTVSKNL